MGFIEDYGLVGLLVVCVGVVVKDKIENLLRVLWANMFKAGAYNLDGDTDTPDWCELVNDNADWYLVKIIEYHFFYRLVEVIDDYGDSHLQRIKTLDFINKPSRSVSFEQDKAIESAGNNWPKAAPNIEMTLESCDYEKLSELSESIRDAATSANSVGTRISNSSNSLRKPLIDLVYVMDKINDKLMKKCGCRKEPK